MRPLLFGLPALGLLSAGVWILLRRLHPEWWRIRIVRRAFYSIPVAGLAGLAGLVVARASGVEFWPPAGELAIFSAFLLLGLIGALAVSGFLAALVRAVGWIRARRAPAAPNASRRALLVHATAAVPGAVVLGALGGALGALADPVVRRLDVPLPGLPSALDGLRILQITDPHLGRYFGLGTLERVLGEVESHRPDLVVVTGDFADDPALIRPGLRLIRALRPRLGIWASLGNHEYYLPGGARQARREFDRGDVPLLVDEGVRIRTGDATLLVGAANDPARMGVEMSRFLADSVEASLRDRGRDDVALLLSHRPDGFDAAARRGVALTLAGHTHGGQIGFRGASIFDPLFPHWYLRGFHRSGDSTLYTSTGFGHWLPIRIGCPAEAPILTLTRGIVRA